MTKAVIAVIAVITVRINQLEISDIRKEQCKTVVREKTKNGRSVVYTTNCKFSTKSLLASSTAKQND